MNRLRIVLPIAALLMAAPAFAQPGHEGHQPAAAASADKTDQAAMHERCKAMMGHRMEGKAAHEHSRDKQGVTPSPKGKGPGKAGMAKMHARCAEMMAETLAKEERAPPAPRQ